MSTVVEIRVTDIVRPSMKLLLRCTSCFRRPAICLSLPNSALPPRPPRMLADDGSQVRQSNPVQLVHGFSKLLARAIMRDFNQQPFDAFETCQTTGNDKHFRM